MRESGTNTEKDEEPFDSMIEAGTNSEKDEEPFDYSEQ